MKNKISLGEIVAREMWIWLLVKVDILNGRMFRN